MTEQKGSRQLFDEAQEVLGQSRLAKLKGNFEEAQILLIRSAQMHEETFKLILPSRPFTQAIVGETAANLYFNAGDYENAARMAEFCLDSVKVPGKPDDLFNKIIYEGAHLEIIWEDACKKLGRPHPTNDFS